MDNKDNMDQTGSSVRPLIAWVLDQFPETPKKRAKQWIEAGRVRIGGAVHRKPHEPLPDPRGALELMDRRDTAAAFAGPRRIHPGLTLVYLDGSIAVVNKSAGLLSVPADRRSLSALDLLARFLGKPGHAARKLPPAYRNLVPLPVHRLDEYTSGLLCFAMNPAARDHLIEAISSRVAGREYIAFTDGCPESSSGAWRHWLKLSDDGLRQTVIAAASVARSKPRDPQVMEAVTHYEVIGRYEIASEDRTRVIAKLRLRLDTGCKHQIRIQAAQEKIPVIGDRTYHPLYQAKSHGGGPVPVPFSRQALHSEILELPHPDRPGPPMRWTAPLPEDLVQLELRLSDASRERLG
ncbi:hypothetical protein HY522_05555 [bacterium]|nr:hypothetical protein [bacterium]